MSELTTRSKTVGRPRKPCNWTAATLKEAAKGYFEKCDARYKFERIAATYFEPREHTDENGFPYMGVSLDTVEEQRIAAEEYIAHLAQKGVPKPSWWKEFLQKIRMWWSNTRFGSELHMTDAQIETLLARAARKVRSRAVVKENLTTETDGDGKVRSGTEEVRFAAALRKPGDPNNAEQKEKLTDGNVPHVSGFMEWAGLKAKNLYADYEFLYSRHHKYFSSPEEAKAAVELVLAKPEQVKDVRKNLSFVGFDEVTGDIYRIEVNPVITGKANHVRSVFKISAANYNEIKLEPPRVLQPSKTALQDGRAATMTITNFMDNISQNPENASGDLSDVSDELRFSLADYDEQTQDDIIAILRPFVRQNIDMEPERYIAYLKEKNVNIPDEDAAVFFRLAVIENDKAARERIKRARDQWLFENFPIFGEVAEFAGGADFKIKPAGHEGEEFTGSFISPEYIKYSLKRPQGKNESDKSYKKYLANRKEKLANAEGMAIDEISEHLSRKLGQDEHSIREQILDFFRHLKKKDLDAASVKDYLEDLKTQVEEFFDLTPIAHRIWENDRDQFLKSIKESSISNKQI